MVMSFSQEARKNIKKRKMEKFEIERIMDEIAGAEVSQTSSKQKSPPFGKLL
jgi:hypothetical protein